jgi:hypothetical protein
VVSMRTELRPPTSTPLDRYDFIPTKPRENTGPYFRLKRRCLASSGHIGLGHVEYMQAAVQEV